MRVLCVTGTDTGVGKTVVTAALAAIAHEQGERVAVVKPAQTGVAPDEPGDLHEITRLSGVEDVHELARFAEPLAPQVAAARAGAVRPLIADVAREVSALSDRDLVVIEGAGGLLVGLDRGGATLADLAHLLFAKVLVVARAGLGTLNHTALTCLALDARGLECPGVVIGSWPDEPDLAAQTNLDELPRAAGVPLLGRIPEGAGGWDRSRFTAAAPGWIDAAALR